MEHKTYGYIRVSTREQNADRQVRAMVEFGILPANMICDKQSGKDFDRPGYKRLVKWANQIFSFLYSFLRRTMYVSRQIFTPLTSWHLTVFRHVAI